MAEDISRIPAALASIPPTTEEFEKAVARSARAIAGTQDVEITTTRTIRVGNYLFREHPDNPGKFSFKHNEVRGECTVENEWSSHINTRRAREMAAALTAFADAAQNDEEAS